MYFSIHAIVFFISRNINCYLSLISYLRSTITCRYLFFFLKLSFCCIHSLVLYINFLIIIDSSNNILGFTEREARLASRVQEIEEQNQLLRRQLSLSQNHLITVTKTYNASTFTIKEQDISLKTTQKKPTVPCISSQVIFSCYFLKYYYQ